METYSALLALRAVNSVVTGEFPWQMTVTRSFEMFSDLGLYKRLGKLSRRWWFESRSHYDVTVMYWGKNKIYLHFLVFDKHWCQPIGHASYIPKWHYCWWPGDARSQGVVLQARFSVKLDFSSIFSLTGWSTLVIPSCVNVRTAEEGIVDAELYIL